VPQNSDRETQSRILYFGQSSLSYQQESQNPVGLNSGQRKERAVCRRVGSALEFVVSKNIRRHLDGRAACPGAAKLRPHFQEEARKRQPYHAETGLPRGPFLQDLEGRETAKKRDFSLNATAAGAAFLVGLVFVSARISRRPGNTRRTRPPKAYPVSVALRLSNVAQGTISKRFATRKRRQNDRSSVDQWPTYSLLRAVVLSDPCPQR
jgi:hypothetical protein